MSLEPTPEPAPKPPVKHFPLPPAPTDPRERKKMRESTEWEPRPFRRAPDSMARRSPSVPLYDPFTKSITTWGEVRDEEVVREYMSYRRRMDKLTKERQTTTVRQEIDDLSSKMRALAPSLYPADRLRRPDDETPGEDIDNQYVEEMESYLDEEQPREFVRDPEKLAVGRIESVRDYVAEERGSQGLQNILKVIAQATPEELDYWQHWYGYAHVDAARLALKHGRPLDLVAGVIAVLSPKEYWPENLYLADRALSQDWDEVQTLLPNKEKAYSLVVENDFSVIGGGKVFDFFLSIADPPAFEQAVVVDTHAINIWRGIRAGEAPQIGDYGPQRRRIQEDYREASKIAGLSPQAVQAITWVIWRQYPMEGELGTAPIESESRGPHTWGKGREPQTRLPADVTEEMMEFDLPEEEFRPPIEPSRLLYQSAERMRRPPDAAYHNDPSWPGGDPFIPAGEWIIGGDGAEYPVDVAPLKSRGTFDNGTHTKPDPNQENFLDVEVPSGGNKFFGSLEEVIEWMRSQGFNNSEVWYVDDGGYRKLRVADATEEPCPACKRMKDVGQPCWWCGHQASAADIPLSVVTAAADPKKKQLAIENQRRLGEEWAAERGLPVYEGALPPDVEHSGAPGMPVYMTNDCIEQSVRPATAHYAADGETPVAVVIPKTAAGARLPPGFEGFDVEVEDEEPHATSPELQVGDRFKVGRFGPEWTVTKTQGAAGYCQRSGHKRKWFGYSYNRETGEIAVYPVKQGSGDRIGDPVAFGPLNLIEGRTAADIPDGFIDAKELADDIVEAVMDELDTRKADLAPELAEQYDREWRQGRPISDIIAEVEFLLKSRGYNPHLARILERLKDMDESGIAARCAAWHKRCAADQEEHVRKMLHGLGGAYAGRPYGRRGTESEFLKSVQFTPEQLEQLGVYFDYFQEEGFDPDAEGEVYSEFIQQPKGPVAPDFRGDVYTDEEGNKFLFPPFDRLVPKLDAYGQYEQHYDPEGGGYVELLGVTLDKTPLAGAGAASADLIIELKSVPYNVLEELQHLAETGDGYEAAQESLPYQGEVVWEWGDDIELPVGELFLNGTTDDPRGRTGILRATGYDQEQREIERELVEEVDTLAEALDRVRELGHKDFRVWYLDAHGWQELVVPGYVEPEEVTASKDGERAARGVEADLLPGGVGDDLPWWEVDPEPLAEGIQHEMEHTDDPMLAAEIATDHAYETDPSDVTQGMEEYYEDLARMEHEGAGLSRFLGPAALGLGLSMAPDLGDVDPPSRAELQRLYKEELKPEIYQRLYPEETPAQPEVHAPSGFEEERLLDIERPPELVEKWKREEHEQRRQDRERAEQTRKRMEDLDRLLKEIGVQRDEAKRKRRQKQYQEYESKHRRRWERLIEKQHEQQQLKDRLEEIKQHNLERGAAAAADVGYAVQVVRREGDQLKPLVTMTDATLSDVADIAAAYQIGTPDFDPGGGVTARGPHNIEMRVSDPMGGEISGVDRQEVLQAMARVALLVRADMKRMGSLFGKVAVRWYDTEIGATVSAPARFTSAYGTTYPQGPYQIIKTTFPEIDVPAFGQELPQPFPQGTRFDNARVWLAPVGGQEMPSRGPHIIAPSDLAQYFTEYEEPTPADVPVEEGELQYQQNPEAPFMSLEEMGQFSSEQFQRMQEDARQDRIQREWLQEVRQQRQPGVGPHPDVSGEERTVMSPHETPQLIAPTLDLDPNPTHSIRPPRRGARRFTAHVEFVVGNDASYLWGETVTMEEILRQAVHYDIRRAAVRDMGAGWLEFHGKPVMGPHGTGRYMLRVDAGRDTVRVAARIAAGPLQKLIAPALMGLGLGLSQPAFADEPQARPQPQVQQQHRGPQRALFSYNEPPGMPSSVKQDRNATQAYELGWLNPTRPWEAASAPHWTHELDTENWLQKQAFREGQLMRAHVEGALAEAGSKGSDAYPNDPELAKRFDEAHAMKPGQLAPATSFTTEQVGF